MKRELKLFTWFDVPVYANWTAAILLFLVVSGLGWFVGLAAIFSILLHEYGHILTARHYGYKTDRVSIFMLGMAAHIRAIPKKGQEAIMALAGPMVNFAIASVILGSIWTAAAIDPTWVLVDKINEPLKMLALVNIVLGIFNLLPMYPLDGGRVIRGTLGAIGVGRLRATQTVAVFSTILALCVLPFAWMNTDPVLAIIAIIAPLYSWGEVKHIKAGRENGTFS